MGESILNSLSDTNEPRNVKIKMAGEKTRKVKDIEIQYEFDEDSLLQTTNYGIAVPLTARWAQVYLNASSTQEGALFIGSPETLKKRFHVKGVSAEHLDKLAFSFNVPWVNAKRELVQTKDGVVVIESIEILQSIITPEEIKSPEFASFKKILRKYCADVAMIVELANPVMS